MFRILDKTDFVAVKYLLFELYQRSKYNINIGKGGLDIWQYTFRLKIDLQPINFLIFPSGI